MGCDGGSIPKRTELVKTKQSAEKPNPQAVLEAKWNLCALSKEMLQEPIVGCQMGNMYNKISILEYLLKKQEFGDAEFVCPHVKSLKDVKVLKLTQNDVRFHQSNSLNQYSDELEAAQFVCPVTKKEMNGRSKFCFLLKCGCVVSEAALKSVNSDKCMVCNTPFKEEEVILINPVTKEELKIASDRVLERNRKQLKKEKRKRALADEEPGLKKKTNINIEMPDMSSLENMKHSKAIAQLYAKGNAADKGNYLTRGTFNRYAAC